MSRRPAGLLIEDMSRAIHANRRACRPSLGTRSNGTARDRQTYPRPGTSLPLRVPGGSTRTSVVPSSSSIQVTSS